MKILNLVVDNLYHSQLGKNIIQNVSKLPYRVDEDILIFTVDQIPIHTFLKCSIMNVGELVCQNGLIVATSLKTANIIKSLPQPKENKLFYVWDLEWLRPYSNNNAEVYFELYNNKHYQLMARSKYHADIISNNFNCEVSHINENCNLEEMMKVAK